MKLSLSRGARVAAGLLAGACAAAALAAPAAALKTAKPAAKPAVSETSGVQVPIEYHKLDNGLKVVLSPDHSSPKAVVAVYYGIGFLIEPKDRTGFAHLFEHMMFQGSQNLGKVEFIKLVQSNGGVLNGSTRFDFTNYFEIVPSHALEMALWAEADRMRGLAINQDNLTNQQGVAKSEVRVNVLNRPYGGFPFLDMPQYANSNWYNSHNFYGDLKDLDAATLSDVQGFFKTYYVPNNAAMAVTGDFDSKETLAWIKKYFGDIPSQKENSSRAGIIAQLAFVDLHGLTADYLNTYVSRVYAVTPAEVRQMASKYIQADKATIVVVGDKNVIADQVAPY